jgi:transposase
MARPASVFAKIKNQRQRDDLTKLWKEHPNHYTRMRGHAIILSDGDYSVEQLVEIFAVDRDTVRAWISRFEQDGIDGLLDEDRPGGPRKLNEQEQQILKDLLRKYPSRPAEVIAQLRARTGKTISRASLRRYAGRFRLAWKRPRRSLRKRRDEKAFRVAQEELAELLNEPDLDIVYFDESGFSLKGVVPYGWLPIGERTDIPVTGAHGSNVQVLGFEHQDGAVETYLHKGYVNSDIVIQIMDDFCQTIDQTTVVVLDNASCHTSGAFKECLERWSAQGLIVYNLPPYSPELNSIERFWKELKYQLMPAEAWERFTTLLNTLTAKLCEIGTVSYMPSLHSYAE